MYWEDFISDLTKSVAWYVIAVSSKTGHSYTHQDTVVFTQIYFIPASSTSKQWLQKSVTARGSPFFNLVLVSAIHHMNICVTKKEGKNFNLGSRRVYSIFVGTCKSADRALDCIASTVKHEIRNKYASKDKQNKQPMNVKRNTQARSCNHCCSGKVISITYCECMFVALVIQHAMRVCRIILSSVECPALQYFSTFSHKECDFREKS
jgi:hypothetical protein